MTTKHNAPTGSQGLVTILRWIFGLYFIAIGIVHFVLPEGLPSLMSWMYDLGDGVHIAAGTAEILGGLGLILPKLTGIMPRLSSLAALGLGLVMIGAIIWHARRGEVTSIVPNAINLVVMAYLASALWASTPPLGGVPAEA